MSRISCSTEPSAWKKYKGFCLTGLSHYNSHSYVLCKEKETVKKEPTDPHKPALSFIASVTPSLLKLDSQMFKHTLKCTHRLPPLTPPKHHHHHHQNTSSPSQVTNFTKPKKSFL